MQDWHLGLNKVIGGDSPIRYRLFITKNHNGKIIKLNNVKPKQ